MEGGVPVRKVFLGSVARKRILHLKVCSHNTQSNQFFAVKYEIIWGWDELRPILKIPVFMMKGQAVSWR